MNTRIQHINTAAQPQTQAVQALYKRYGGMLLGYIFDVVKDEQLAEQYLVDTFKEAYAQLGDAPADGSNQYCKLQLLARKKLSPFFETLKDCGPEDHFINNGTRSNKFIDKMSVIQQQVFCGVHYHGKNVTTLAAELGTNEGIIKKILKEAFVIIRTNRSDAAVY